MKIVVTGGTGLVGHGIQNIQHNYTENNKKYEFMFVSSKDCNLSDFNQVQQFFEKE